MSYIRLMKNKYDLDRNIPNAIKREIRQRDGFGCVICGFGIIQYEHVNPEFNEAKIHDPKCMTILCPACHANITTKMWSKEKVIEAMINPKCLSQGYSKQIFDIGAGFPTIKIGSNVFKNVNAPILVDSTPLLVIDGPENKGEPFKISGKFLDSEGKDTLEIIENEWHAFSNSWDVEIVGSSITIKEKKGKIHLKLDSEPPEGINISRLDMQMSDLNIKIENQELMVVNLRTGQEKIYGGNNFINMRVGVTIYSE